jgi:hypothetical protein
MKKRKTQQAEEQVPERYRNQAIEFAEESRKGNENLRNDN